MARCGCLKFGCVNRTTGRSFQQATCSPGETEAFVRSVVSRECVCRCSIRKTHIMKACTTWQRISHRNTNVNVRNCIVLKQLSNSSIKDRTPHPAPAKHPMRIAHMPAVRVLTSNVDTHVAHPDSSALSQGRPGLRWLAVLSVFEIQPQGALDVRF